VHDHDHTGDHGSHDHDHPGHDAEIHDRYDLLEYIQEKVIVDLDNNRKLPVGFTHKRKRHSTREILGCFRTQPNCHINAFLVRTTFVYSIAIQKADLMQAVGY
jgi:hypothetical protein